MVHVIKKKMKTWMAFNKNGIGGDILTAKTKKIALRKARFIHGIGATVEYQGIKECNVIKL